MLDSPARSSARLIYVMLTYVAPTYGARIFAALALKAPTSRTLFSARLTMSSTTRMRGRESHRMGETWAATSEPRYARRKSVCCVHVNNRRGTKARQSNHMELPKLAGRKRHSGSVM